MANYYSTCRTNYFKVKDLEEFRKWAGTLTWEGFEICEGKNGTICILCDNGWPNCKLPDYESFDFLSEFKQHLPDNEVVIFVEAGNERHRYVNGIAIAIMKGRKPISVDINDIYDKAKKRFGVKEISLAEH